VNDNASSAYHLYPVRLRSALSKKKKEIFSALKKSGLGVQVHYIPVYQHPYYKKSGFAKCNCPKAEDLYSGEISIPIFPALEPIQAQYAASTILKVCKKFKKA
jgi:dTDP-4-amino-4,6-dideoxygalactose transaminase